VSELTNPVVSHADGNADILEVAYTALALGLVELSTCDEEADSVLMQRRMGSSDTDLDAARSHFLALRLRLAPALVCWRCGGTCE
jgi:26S proteasome regulatory subunit N1